MHRHNERRAGVAHASAMVGWLARTGAVAALLLLAVAPRAVDGKTKSKPKASSAHVTVGQGRNELPPAVNEMRDAILAAARSGRLDELLIPIQWNELPPDFGDLSVKDTLSSWKKNSPDGSGRAWLAKLIDTLEAPYAVVRRGPDIENNKVFIWPAFAELALKKLSPALHVELLRLAPADDVARMIAQDHYDGFGLAIGADGTWHAFKKVSKSAKAGK